MMESDYKGSAPPKALEDAIKALQTEAGKAAFALANGWPLPEEILSLKKELNRAQHENERLRAGLRAVAACAWECAAPGVSCREIARRVLKEESK